jgi:hypothetical protein
MLSVLFYYDAFRCVVLYDKQLKHNKHSNLMSHKDGSCELKHVAQCYMT